METLSEGSISAVKTLNFDKSIVDNQGYKVITSMYEQSLIDIEKKINEFFDPLDKSQDIMIQDCINSLRERYKEVTCGFEDGIREVTAAYETVDKTNKIEVKRLKRKLDDIMLMVESEKDIDNQFAEIFLKLENKLKYLKLKSLQKPDFKFTLLGKLDRLEWKGGNNILTIPPGGSSYKCFVTDEVFESEVTCTIRLNKFQTNFAGSYWNYGFGLIQNGNETNESSYYNFTAMLQSNGYTNVKFSGSSDTTKRTEQWNTGDEVTLVRDSNGTVFFSLNRGERVETFKDVNGAMRVVFGVSSSITGDEIELIECGPYNI